VHRHRVSDQRSVQKVLPILPGCGSHRDRLWVSGGFQEPQTILASSSSVPAAAVNLKTLVSPSFQAIAIEHFNKDNLSAGCLAVEELERGALQSAKQLLAVSDAQQNERQLSPGRLAWQSIKTGDTA